MTDLLIIGGGPGGYGAALYAAKCGLRVALVEEGRLGGTCLMRGCIPTKALVHDAEKFAALREGGADVDAHRAFAEAMRRKEAVVEGLCGNLEAMFRQRGIAVVGGRASLRDAHTAVVNGEVIEAANVIIATGGVPSVPPLPGLGNEGAPRNPSVLTSAELLSVEALPGSLCVVGAGVIGMEMASVFAGFGCKVAVVELLNECLPTVDGEIAKRLRKNMERQGIEFHMGCGVERVEGGTVHFRDAKRREGAVEAERILIATGRRPNTDGLGLDVVGVHADKHGIRVDGNMQTNVAGVYAVGDVNGLSMLAHAATFQARRAVNHILGREDNIRLDIVPSAVFTRPEAAGVGLTEEACRERGVECRVRKAIYRANGRAQAAEQAEGMLKLVCGGDGLILGCHAYGASASSLVQEVAVLLNFGATVGRLADIIHIHPTLGEILLDAAMG